MGYDDRAGYAVATGPTMRMLVDLGDLDQSRWVNQSGVSGHAYHRNYDDQTPLWVAQPDLAVRVQPGRGGGPHHDAGSNWCPAAEPPARQMRVESVAARR